MGVFLFLKLVCHKVQPVMNEVLFDLQWTEHGRLYNCLVKKVEDLFGLGLEIIIGFRKSLIISLPH